MVLILGAARTMTSTALSVFSLVQLLIMSGVTLQRALFLSPALATQRTDGRSLVPVRWTLKVSLPGAILLAGLISALMGSPHGDSWIWLLPSFAASAAALVQDVLRFCLISRNRLYGAVVSDGLWLGFICLTVVPNDLLASATALTTFWGATGGVAVTTALLFCRTRQNSPSEPMLSIRRTWRLGKWSGLDAGLSATANLAPMLMTALVIGSEYAGTYRVLQSSLGPLNILSTSMITMLGLDSWKFVTHDSLSSLQRTVRRALLSMVLFASAYIALAELAIIAFAELQTPEMVRIALIVGVVGVVGAVTAPLSAASLALGYQKDGAILRVVIVGFSLGASILSGLGVWLPWNDPIGTVTIFAAAAGLAGWWTSYRRAMRVEIDKLVPPSALMGGPRHMAGSYAQKK